MRETALNIVDLEAALRPETTLEKKLLHIPAFHQGLHWGVPRYGHPEGEIYRHVREVFDNIDRLQTDPELRTRLRLIALVHDTFKYCEDKNHPRDWSRHHGMLGRRFLEHHHDDPVVLDIIELHDEAYYCWRTTYLYHQPLQGGLRLERLMARIEDQLQLYYLFFKCDTLTGDKTLAPLRWFEQHIKGIEIVNL